MLKLFKDFDTSFLIDHFHVKEKRVRGLVCCYQRYLCFTATYKNKLRAKINSEICVPIVSPDKAKQKTCLFAKKQVAKKKSTRQAVNSYFS